MARRPDWHALMPAIWRPTGDPSAYAPLAVDARPLQAILAEAQRRGLRLRPTAVVVKALGLALAAVPGANVTLRWGRVRRRDRVDVWVTVADAQGDLYGTRVDRVHERTVLAIQAELDAAAARHRDPRAHGRRHSGAPTWVLRMPPPVTRLLVRLAAFIVHDLRLPVRGFVGREGFGAVHVTSVGSQGLTWSFAPIPPMTRQAALLLVGKIHDAPVVRDGKVVASPILPVSVTVDHRMMVGLVVNRLRQAFLDALEDPSIVRRWLPPHGAPAQGEAAVPQEADGDGPAQRDAGVRHEADGGAPGSAAGGASVQGTTRAAASKASRDEPVQPKAA